MIIARAPLRISFVGGGTDLPDFYQISPGRVISATIDQYVYTVVNQTPLMKKISARYAVTELVNHPSELKNDRIREALLDLNILHGIEVGTFSHLPGGTGLGSSSSFSVGLMKALHATQGKKMGNYEVAEAASRLEIELVKEPIGKQDQYAAAFGGFNIFQFNPDHSVEVTPLMLDYKKKSDFENHLLMFFTGITRQTASVLTEQKANIPKKIDTLKGMADAVYQFRELLMLGDFEGLGKMMHDNWLKKKSLASNVSNPVIDSLYQAGINGGAWGGKVLGAGGGGCLLFFVSSDKKESIRSIMKQSAENNNLERFNEIPVKFVQSGAEILINTESVKAEETTDKIYERIH
ncbi:MAG: GHMP kinase [Patescibacteria group bacterium]